MRCGECGSDDVDAYDDRYHCNDCGYDDKGPILTDNDPAIWGPEGSTNTFDGIRSVITSDPRAPYEVRSWRYGYISDGVDLHLSSSPDAGRPTDGAVSDSDGIS